MKCDEARRLLPLYLYHELGFDEEERLELHLDGCQVCRDEVARQKRLHQLLDQAEPALPEGLLTGSRLELRSRLRQEHRPASSFWSRMSDLLAVRLVPAPAAAQILGAVALLAIGFFGARIAPFGPLSRGGGSEADVLAEPAAERVRYIEPGQSDRVRIVIEETRQRVIAGRVADDRIRHLLMDAARDPADAGVRVESVDLLQSQCDSADIRNTMLYALEHDSNAGVRLKALDGLRRFAMDAPTRDVLTHVLLTDDNPGVRTGAIDMLVQHKEDQMVGVLQGLLHHEDNGYVRQRCERALHDMNASAETY